MRNVRGEARRGNARDRLGQSSVNPSAGSRARRKSTRFRRTISWRDLSRPSTKGARPDTSPRMYKREIKIDRERERERERYSCHEFPLRSRSTCPNPSLSSRPEDIPDTLSRYPFPESGDLVFGT